jgi:hypothetical protein
MTSTIRNVVTFLGVSLAVIAVSMANAGSSVRAPAPVQDTMTDAAACFTTTMSDERGEQSLCGKCGDHFCNPSCGETPTSCPADCGDTTI